MEATAERIRRHGFGRPRYFETLICRRGRTPIGFALYYFTYSTFLGRPTLYLEDLFVLAEARGNGAGRALLRDRKSTRLNSSHSQISYAVFCLKKKKTE